MITIASGSDLTGWFANPVRSVAMRRQALRTDNLRRLETWLADDGSSRGSLSMGPLKGLRQILGAMAKDMGELSSLYMYANRSPSPVLSQKISAVLSDLGNAGRLPSLIDRVLACLQSARKAEGEQIDSISNLIRTTLHLAYSIRQMEFSPDQIRRFQDLASYKAGHSGFASLSDEHAMQGFFSKMLYEKFGHYSLTLRAVREALQNACDAVRQKRHREAGHGMSVEIHTTAMWSDGPGEDRMDLQIVDNGIGMDWQTLTSRFYVYFGTGKMMSDDTGGFGVGKAVIQETPRHGWAVDTNELHSSHFQRNLYFAVPQERHNELPVRHPYIKQQGTSITLYGVPVVSDESIGELASKFSTMPGLSIGINGKEVEPVFRLDELSPVGRDLEILPSLASSDAKQQDALRETQAKMTAHMKTELGQPSKAGAGQPLQQAYRSILEGGVLQFPDCRIRFFLKPALHRYTANNAYFMLNGQYQFDSSEFVTNWVTLVVDMQTNVRPQQEGYPIDMAREHLREPYQSAIRAVLRVFSDVFEEASRILMANTGVITRFFNTHLDPIHGTDKPESSFDPVHDKISDRDKSVLAGELMNSIVGSVQQHFRPGKAPTSGPLWEKPSQEPETEDQAAKQRVLKGEEVSAQIGRLTGKQLDQTQANIAGKAIEVINLIAEQTGRQVTRQEANLVVDLITSPFVMEVDQQFLQKEQVLENPERVVGLLMLWQGVLRMVADETIAMDPQSDVHYVPGLIYHGGNLAQWRSVHIGHRPVHVISVNPLTVASVVLPGGFSRSGLPEPSQEGGTANVALHTESGTRLDAVCKLATFLFHAATHEVTHMLYPETSVASKHSSFHLHITMVEMRCHHLYPRIQSLVFDYFPQVLQEAGAIMQLGRGNPAAAR
jgi:hypothetical protein